ncbi:MAG: toxin HipA, partial [Burkholderiales bacterium PBB5]
MCQALGVPGSRRYESDGGPGVAALLRRLDASKQPEQDKRVFLQAQFMFWLLAATDGHAKNFSIFLERAGFRLTPLYDVLSIWPIIGNRRGQIHWRDARLAMAARATSAHYRLHEIQTRHWQALARSSGMPDLFDTFVAMALQVPLVLEQVRCELARGFPAG